MAPTPNPATTKSTPVSLVPRNSAVSPIHNNRNVRSPSRSVEPSFGDFLCPLSILARIPPGFSDIFFASGPINMSLFLLVFLRYYRAFESFRSHHIEGAA
jgi:hypothetical protein